MKKISKFLKNNLHWFIVGGTGLLCALLIFFGTPNEQGYYTLNGKVEIPEETKQWFDEAKRSLITYANENTPAIIINSEGEQEIIDVPTIDSIDDNGPIQKICPEGEECGLGAFIYAPTETFEAFKNYTLAKCWNVDGYAGSQCWDLAALHWMNYTKDGRTLSTCGTGAAKGSWNCKEQNAGSEYELIFDRTEIRVGDFVVTGSGIWGHICEAAGPYNNDHVACLGQNQGGSSCPGGGSTANIVNLKLNNFLGAFRPKTYVPIEPDPTPTPSAPDTGRL